MARGDEDLLGDLVARRPGLTGRRRGRRLVKKAEEVTAPLSATKEILLLDLWNRSGLPARDFAALTGLSHHTLYALRPLTPTSPRSRLPPWHVSPVGFLPRRVVT